MVCESRRRYKAGEGEWGGDVFFQEKDGIRDRRLYGVRTCALPIGGEQVNECVHVYVPIYWRVCVCVCVCVYLKLEIGRNSV